MSLGLATCFFERDPGVPLTRRCLAEGLGTSLLMFAVCAAPAAVAGLSVSAPQAVPVAGVVADALAVSGALVALIVALGAVSGGHFNPLITVLQWLSGERGAACTFAYIAAQVAGAFAGVLLSALLAGSSGSVSASVTGVLVLSELIASGGLLLIVAGTARSGKAETGPFAVGGWIAAAIVATPSRCYANPAITVAAMAASGPPHLSMLLAGAYLAAQVAGALIALGLANLLYPVRQ